MRCARTLHPAGLALLVCAVFGVAGALPSRAAAAAPDLSVSVVAAPDPAVVGGRLTLTVTVTNDGGADATGAKVVFLVVQDFAVVSAPGCNQFGPTILCELGTVRSGAAVTRRIVFGNVAAGTFNLTAQAQMDMSDPTPNDDAVAISTTVNQRPDLRLIVSGPTSGLVQGASVVLSFEISNIGRGPAPDVQLRIVLPDGIAPAGLPPGCDAETSSLVVCALGLLGASTSDFRVLTLGGLPAGTHTVLASVRSDLRDGEIVADQGEMSLLVAEPVPNDPVVPTVLQASIRTVASGTPASGGCVAGRRLTLRLRGIGGSLPALAQVFIDGRQVRALSGAAIGRPIVLKRLPRRRFVLKVLSTLPSGGSVSAARPLRPCGLRSRGGRK